MVCVASIEDIELSLARLAEAIEHRYWRQQSPTIVWMTGGAMHFQAMLTHRIKLALPRIEVIRPEMIQGITDKNSQVDQFLPTPMAVAHKDVILMDTVLKSGNAMHSAIELLKLQGARRVETCVLIKKNGRMKFPIAPTYCALSSEDYILAGYGLELNGSYRNQAYIGVPKETLRPTQRPRRAWHYTVDSGTMW